VDSSLTNVFFRKRPAYLVFVVFVIVASTVACSFPEIFTPRDNISSTKDANPLPVITPTPTQHPLISLLPPSREPGEGLLSPTPDPVRNTPTVRTDVIYHVVQAGETLGQIAEQYNVSVLQISQANRLSNVDYLAVGQLLEIPAPIPQPEGPSNKLIPDSELVYGPASVIFDLQAEVDKWDGYLSAYTEEVESEELTGAQIVQLVAQRYSVDPRLLLAVLEYQGGWVTNANVDALARDYPIGYQRQDWGGLFVQLSWAADQLNQGYYLWRAGWVGPLVFSDGKVIVPGPGLNAGSVGVQYLFAQLYGVEAWRGVISAQGFIQTYTALFGNPFERAIEPLVPPDLEQPLLQLPFENGKVWSFTGGPHSAWGDGAAWAALDFAPPGYALGCGYSDEWVVAAADGQVLRSENGEVILDLDGDGYEQTGWVLLYMHVESRDRVAVGTYLHAGERIGHPSCEGGFATGLHVHIARKFRGEWIAADGRIPFVMDGWVSAGDGTAYSGTLHRDRDTIESCECRNETNQIGR
jgi:LasA protease